MKEEIEKTIKNLLDKLNAECNRDEIVVLSQAVLNLSNARYDASSLYGQSWSGDLRKEKTCEELINEAANKQIDVKSLNEQVTASRLNAVSYAATASDETLDGQCASKSNAERLSGLGGAFIGGVQQMSIHDKWNAEIMGLRNLAKDIRLTGLASGYAERAYLELEKISQEVVAKSIWNKFLCEGLELTQKAIKNEAKKGIGVLGGYSEAMINKSSEEETKRAGYKQIYECLSNPPTSRTITEQDIAGFSDTNPSIHDDFLLAKDREQLVMMLLERGCGGEFVVEIVKFIMSY